MRGGQKPSLLLFARYVSFLPLASLTVYMDTYVPTYVSSPPFPPLPLILGKGGGGVRRCALAKYRVQERRGSKESQRKRDR